LNARILTYHGAQRAIVNSQRLTVNSHLHSFHPSIRGIRDSPTEGTMQTTLSTTAEAPLLTYVIASSDMRYIEVNRRNVHLRHDPDSGLLIRGEIPETLPSCDAGLAFMLLEYAMSCQDCKDPLRTAAALDRFGQDLARALLEKLQPPALESSAIDRLIATLGIVLSSMPAEFTVHLAPREIGFSLAACPLREAAGQTALRPQVPMAHRALIALCDALLLALAPEWTRAQPAERETQAPLYEILLQRI
jgi:hypothetical protein